MRADVVGATVEDGGRSASRCGCVQWQWGLREWHDRVAARSLFEGRFFLGKNNSAARLRVHPLRHTSPRPDLLFPIIAILRTRTLSPPMRKPQC